VDEPASGWSEKESNNASRVELLFRTLRQRVDAQDLSTAKFALTTALHRSPRWAKDLVHAYMWFLIASEQITQSKNHVNLSMTVEQLLEAEQRAAQWMRKTKKMPPSSIDTSQRI
jgi:hypothetical protein